MFCPQFLPASLTHCLLCYPTFTCDLVTYLVSGRDHFHCLCSLNVVMTKSQERIETESHVRFIVRRFCMLSIFCSFDTRFPCPRLIYIYIYIDNPRLIYLSFKKKKEYIYLATQTQSQERIRFMSCSYIQILINSVKKS